MGVFGRIAGVATITTMIGCASFTSLAAPYAKTQIGAAEVVRRDASVAGSMCRRYAIYAYDEMRLGKGPHGVVEHPPGFEQWYGAEPASKTDAGAPLAWRPYCAELDATGTVFHASVVSLRDFAGAMQVLAEGKDFDTSGIGKLGDGAGTIATALSASDTIISVIKGVSGATSFLAGMLVKQARDWSLKDIVKHVQPHVDKVFEGLIAYEGELATFEAVVLPHQRLAVGVANQTIPSSTSDATLAYDLSSNGDAWFANIAHDIETDKALLTKSREAFAALANVASGHGNDKSATSAADALEKALRALLDERPRD